MLPGLLGRLGLFVASVLLACSIIEIMLRFWEPIPEIANPLHGFHVSDPELGWKGRPNIRMRFHRADFDALVENEADGWRKPDLAPPAQASEKVLFLGDSFTWGWGVSQGEVFTDELQRRLRTSVAVYNRGVNAFGTAQEFILMQHELAATHYDKIVVMFFYNDVRNNIDGRRGERPYFKVVDDQLLPVNQPPMPMRTPFTQFLKNHSRVVHFIDFELNMLRERLRSEHDENDDDEAGGGARLDLRALPGSTETVWLLAAMAELALRQKGDLFVVWVPHRSELQQRPSAVPYVRAVRALIEDACRQSGISFIDLADLFYERTQGGEELIFRHDEHWNAAGHRLVADVLQTSAIFAARPSSARD